MESKGKKPTARMLLGKRGEDVACRFLKEKGQRIIERNFRNGHLEIDIISIDGNGVHFVEVKSRVAPVVAGPEENVTPAKQRKIAEAASRYLRGPKAPEIGGNLEVSFDIVAVTFDGGEERVEWFPGAYIPMFF